MSDRPTVLVLTPAKDAVRHLGPYFDALCALSYPTSRISLGVLESDSIDGSYDALAQWLEDLGSRYRRVGLWKRDFGFRVPAPIPRWDPAVQLPRRTVLAKARNHLLFNALTDDIQWVLWIDVDVCGYPSDIIERFLDVGLDILHPHCVIEPGGPTYDRNAWRDKGRLHMDDLRGGPDVVRLDAVGGTMLWVRADIHRDGLIFPPYLYGSDHRAARESNEFLPDGVKGEIESEGLGLMAQDMGYQCWGLPNLEVFHAKG
jgi:hypothetical protein